MTDTLYRWVPPGLNEDAAQEFLTVRTGIPDAARDELTAWITHGNYGHEYYPFSSLVRFQAASGINLKLSETDGTSVKNARQLFRRMDEQALTYFLDFLISDYKVNPNRNSAPDRVTYLGRILHSAGSSWDVGERQGRYGLVERVPAGVAQVVDQVLSHQDKASGMLRSAWEKAYGMSPSPSDAYHDAVKAVEIVAAPLVSPKNDRATLGTIFRDLEAQEKNDVWDFVMAGSKDTTAVQHLISTMKLLWHSQSDRHGSKDYEHVTPKEAQAAVLLASTIVGWLAQGALSKKAP